MLSRCLCFLGISKRVMGRRTPVLLYWWGFRPPWYLLKGDTALVGLPIAHQTSVPKEWQGDHEHLPRGQAALSVPFSINQSSIVVGRKMGS